MSDKDMSYEEFVGLQMEPGPEQSGSPDMLGEPGPEPPTLRELAERVCDLRNMLLVNRTELATRQAVFNDQNSEIITTVRCQAEQLAQAEQELREAAMQAYRVAGDKAPGPGVSVRMVTKVQYEPAEALDWAKEHQIALALNTKHFEKLAKAGLASDVATVTTEPQAVIATDLSKALDTVTI